MDLEAIPYILVLGVFYGTTIVASRFSVGQFEPTTYIGLRYAFGSLGFIIIYSLRLGRRIWPKDRQLWKQAILLGVVGTAIPMTGFVTSLKYQSSGVTSVLITASPAITVLLAHFALPDERLTPRKSAGVLLALGGALLIAIRGESGLPDMSQASPIGYGLVFIGILFSSMMKIYVRKYMRTQSSFDVSAVRMLTAAVTIIPISLLLVGFDLSRVNAQGWFAVFYAAVVGTFAAMLLDFYNTKRFGATASAMVSYVIPVIAGVIGVLILDEQFTPGMFAGMALIVVGVWLINRKRVLAVAI